MHGDSLRSRVELPVVMVKVGGYDLMRALAQARTLSARVALVTFGAVRPEVEQFSRRFGLDIVQRSYRSEEQAALVVDELRAAGIEVVVAPGLVADLAEAAGMTGLLLYSPDAVRQAIDDAIEVARTARISAAKRERLNTIIAQLRDGVVAVDTDERIEALNPPIERLLGASREQLLGRRLGELAPELSLQRTLRDGVEETDEVARLGGRTVVLSRRGIHERGVTTGAVLTCQDPASIQRAERNLRARSTARGARYRLDEIVGDSATMREARRLAARYAQSEATVLIVGESGTGKELFAQGIHAASRRAHQPFVAVNCAAFPEALLESELFGYEEGAFTGARKAGKIGLFEAAHRGTLFLDEIGEMPASLQTRLLRVLQEREILRVGATEPTPIDVRVIAATHRSLAERIDAGAFRRDLYYRLNILRLELAALRDRAGDLKALAVHLFDKLSARHGGAPSAALHELLQRASGYDWPGNVRELENMIERVVCAGEAPAELLPELAGAAQPLPAANARQLAARAERDAIARVLAECGGNRAEACARLGMGRTTLWRKMRAADAA
ncbi:propionate catabolism operon regulatory protein [mine drainage metagenome]|uniref:Propionate catabolism operon regulatory protein n=1 Tax=mine drainage metagenome TaxID=410659 RepID=A0A1J5QCG2_9ZZZZ